MSIFLQRSIPNVLMVSILSFGMLAPCSFANTVVETAPSGQFAYKDRLQFAASVMNTAVDAFNSGVIRDFSSVLSEFFESTELQELESIVKAKDRLPKAYIVGGTSVKFLYMNENTYEDSGLVLDFSAMEQGIIKFNGTDYSYNQSRSFGEWYKLFKDGQSDVAFSFSIISNANAFIGALLAAIGAMFSSLFGGGKTTNKNTQSVPSVATYQRPRARFSVHRARYGSSAFRSRRSVSFARPEPTPSSEVVSRAAATAKPTPSRRVASSSKSENEKKSDYVRSISSNIGRHVANIAVARLGKGVPNSVVPDRGLRCAEQASYILVQAGILGSRYTTVTAMVRRLKSMGWKVSDKPVPGAVAYSRDAFPETRKIPGESSVRPHVGVVGTDLAVYHNSGAAGGTIVRSTSRDGDRNGRWVKYAIKYLLPPDAKTAQLILDYFFKGGVYAQLKTTFDHRS